MSTLLSVSIAALAGLLMTRVFSLWRLPDVTAYLVAGVLIGPYVLGSMHITGLGLVSAEAVSSLQLVSEVALGFIAFSIGNEFRLEDLKSTGNQAAIIGVVQALTATLLVDAALLTVHMLLPEKLSAAQAITLGAIATATAPAATLMVVRQYKAKGPVTNLLLPIVALDDAVGLIVFAVSFGISKALVSGELDLISILLNPLLEIVASLALGAAAGWLLTKLEVLFHSNTNRLNMKEPPQKDNKKPILRISVEEPAENPQALLFAHVRKGRKQPVNCPRPRYLKSAAKNDLSIRVKPHRYTMCTYGA